MNRRKFLKNCATTVLCFAIPLELARTPTITANVKGKKIIDKGGYLVPEKFVKEIMYALEHNNLPIQRTMGIEINLNDLKTVIVVEK